jgi:3-methyladenine DNA glycosylase AlkD
LFAGPSSRETTDMAKTSAKTTRPTLAAARKRLRDAGNPKDAEFLQRFFKTAPGQYGAGDKFLGIRVPATRAIARDFHDLAIDDIAELLTDDWHEARSLAVILLSNRYAKGSPAEREEIFDLYVANAARVNNWDLVDASAPNIVGAHLETRKRGLLDKLARSKNLWERRIAIVSTFRFIRNDEFDDTVRISRALMRDEEDLIHKAVGWMLREVGKRDASVLEKFLEEHAHELPRTALRYAIERMTPEKKRRFMAAKQEREAGAGSSSRR